MLEPGYYRMMQDLVFEGQRACGFLRIGDIPLQYQDSLRAMADSRAATIREIPTTSG